MVYVIQLASRIRTELHPDPARKMSANLYDIYLLMCVQWKTPDDGQRNCPKHVNSFYLNVNQLDALKFIMSLFHASTCFEHMCSLLGGQNCIIEHLVSSHSVGGRPLHRLRESSLNLCTGSQPVHRTATYRVWGWDSPLSTYAPALNLCTGRPPTECDDTRGCIV